MPMVNKTLKWAKLVKKDYWCNLLQIDIASKIYLQRKKLWMSQTYLAKKSKCTQTMISEIEGWENNTTIETLYRICKALDMKLKISLE